MAPHHAKKESLWNRVEAARLQWLHAHDDVMEVNRHITSLPTSDGSYAYSRAIHVEELAVKNYCMPSRSSKLR